MVFTVLFGKLILFPAVGNWNPCLVVCFAYNMGVPFGGRLLISLGSSGFEPYIFEISLARTNCTTDTSWTDRVGSGDQLGSSFWSTGSQHWDV